MCRRYWRDIPSQEACKDLFEVLFDVDKKLPNFNMAPTTQNPIVLQHNGEQSTETFGWGLVPPYEKERKPTDPYINARKEKVNAHGAYKKSFQKYRCIVPASGCYEWRKKDRNKKIPLFTIITTDNNNIVREIHNSNSRMPVILNEEDFDWWLDPENKNTKVIKEAGVFEPYPDDGMYRYPLSQKVNSVCNNDIQLIKEVDEWS